jgi:hypothetical protein
MLSLRPEQLGSVHGTQDDILRALSSVCFQMVPERRYSGRPLCSGRFAKLFAAPSDADMGAFYIWLNLSHLSGFQSSRFIACHERGSQAFAIAPSIPAGTISSQRCNLTQILHWTT